MAEDFRKKLRTLVVKEHYENYDKIRQILMSKVNNLPSPKHNLVGIKSFPIEANGGFGKQGYQMAVASFAPKSKYIHQIYFYTVHSIISCIHSKASIKFINPFQIRSNY